MAMGVDEDAMVAVRGRVTACSNSSANLERVRYWGFTGAAPKNRFSSAFAGGGR